MWISRPVFLAVALATLSSVVAEPPVLRAVRAERAPMIDGQLSDICWRSAPVASGFLINNTARPATAGSEARIVYDDDTLYISVMCAEPDPGSIQTRPLPRDHGDIFRTDCIEIMLDPGRSQNQYVHIGVNASGSVADRLCRQGGYIGDLSWDGDIEAASAIGTDSWSCEVAIPFYCLDVSAKVGSTWGINICREKKNPPENSSVADQGAFNIASRFAELRGVDADLSRFGYAIGSPETDRTLADGQLELSLRVPIRNETGSAPKRLLDVWLVGPNGKVSVAKTTASPPANEERPFDFGPIRIAKQGDYSCYVRVADPITKRALAVRKSSLSLRFVPLAISLVKPWYRNAIFATQDLQTVVADVRVGMNAEARRNAVLKVSIVDSGSSNVLAEMAVEDVDEKTLVSFGATALPETTMQVVAMLKGKEGNTLAEASLRLRKLPYRPGEVWLGQDMHWRVDGKPFFLNGGWNYADGFVPGYNAFSGNMPGDVKRLDTYLMNMLHYKAKSLRTDELSDVDAEFCRAYARKVGTDPKLFAYFVSDEPEGSNIKAKVLERVYDSLADEDPYHPVVISNDSMHGMHAYARCADINGLHPYPVILGDKRVNDLGSVKVFVEGSIKTFASSAHKQTIAYLHQGFNYGDHGAVNNRIPTYVEYRNQNLLALICGAVGLIQFNRMVAHYPELYLGMPALTREFASLGPVILAPASTSLPTADSDTAKMMLKEHDGELYLLACNADMTPRRITFTIPGIAERAAKLQVIPEGRSVTLSGDRLSDRFDTYEVHVYTTAVVPDLPTVAETVAQIQEANRQRHKQGNLAYQEYEGGDVVVTASSNQASKYRRPDTGLWHVVDGIIDKSDRYQCLTWQDTTKAGHPDWLEIALPKPEVVGRVVVYPFEKSLRDYAIQAHVDGQWQTLDEVKGQSTERVTHRFDPTPTDRVRLWVTATNGPTSMVSEVEVYEK